MRKRRQLAPRHRKGLDAGGLEPVDEAVAAALAALEGKAAIYHCVSRVVNRERVLRREERDVFVEIMRRYEAFSVHVLTHCVMPNHFHILVEVPAPPEDRGAAWSDERLLEHTGLIYSRRKVAGLRWTLEHFRAQGDAEAADALRASFLRRMWDLSEFMKIVKQCFTQWFNRRHGRHGVLWEERFRSGLVEDGHAARRVAACIDLNPVRAGLVADPKDWRWSGARRGGGRQNRGPAWPAAGALRGGRRPDEPATGAREVSDAKELLRRYRRILFLDGAQRRGTRAGTRPQSPASGSSRSRPTGAGWAKPTCCGVARGISSTGWPSAASASSTMCSRWPGNSSAAPAGPGRGGCEGGQRVVHAARPAEGRLGVLLGGTGEAGGD